MSRASWAATAGPCRVCDQVQGQIDAAGDAGRCDHPVVGGEQDVADDHYLGVAQGQVLHIVVDGAVAAVEQASLAERLGSGADAGTVPPLA